MTAARSEQAEGVHATVVSAVVVTVSSAACAAGATAPSARRIGTRRRFTPDSCPHRVAV
jgi:hypothetical protein